MKQAMPVGVDDFAEIREKNYYFVDKSRFVQEILDNKDKVTLITRPRRFGKTLNLSLLKYFFTLENADENRKLFAGLAIEQAGTSYMREQGTRPVIFMSFKDIKKNTWPGQLETLVNIIAQLYREYLFLLDSSSLNSYERNYIISICNKKAGQTDFEESLVNLCALLARHYGTKPILLLDEYDTPIITAWEHQYYDDCMEFMRRLYGMALKNNKYLDFAVLTGITRVAKESIFSGLNNLLVCGVLSDFYADIFGFTLAETEKLLQDSGYADKIADLKEWYDGYIFGGKEIYNPWSVVNFVKNRCELRPYWINVSENAILKKLLANIDADRHEELQKLMLGETVFTTINENIVYTDLANDHDALYTLLLHTGYLKAVQIEYCLGDIEEVSVKIPNREIRTAYKQEILRYVAKRRGLTVLRQTLSTMLAGETEKFTAHLSSILLDYVSFNDTAHNPECFYHGLILGLSVLTEEEYRVESNRESGYGRFDIAFFPKNSGGVGVILEIKVADFPEEMDIQARAAVKQIEDKAYITELHKQGVTRIWKYGIAFCGKKIAIHRG